jgi:uncharacterized BrkB/YihY/UPF0761 family membrane protein
VNNFKERIDAITVKILKVEDYTLDTTKAKLPRVLVVLIAFFMMCIIAACLTIVVVVITHSILKFIMPLLGINNASAVFVILILFACFWRLVPAKEKK